MKEAICPNCETLFDASKHRAYKGILADFREYTRIGHRAPETWIDENSMVLCPNCGVTFKSEAVRFLGCFSPRGLKIFIGFGIFVFMCFALVSLISAFL
jgi:uncharacterized Zn-finger protein